MVRVVFPLALLLVGCAATTSPADGLHADLPAVEHLAITENGMGSPTDASPPDSCEAFRLDEAQVARFMGAAEGVERRDYMHTLDWSPCHARGRIRFEGGRAGVWTIRQYRTGSILFDDGSELFLYCPGCTWEPFVQ